MCVYVYVVYVKRERETERKERERKRERKKMREKEIMWERLRDCRCISSSVCLFVAFSPFNKK